MEVLELMFILHRLEPYVRNTTKRGGGWDAQTPLPGHGICHLLGQKKAGTLHISLFYGALLETLVVTEFFKQAT
jgi:hypothetical protein